MSEKNLEQMDRLFAGVEPTDELNGRVISRVHELRAAQEAGAATGGPFVTRRVALAGAAGCAVMAGLALGLPALLSPTSDDNSFGLAIARATEGEGAVAVTSGPDGLMPYENDTRPSFHLKLNLGATGAGIGSVTYRVEGSPVLTIENPSVHNPQTEYPAVTLAQGSVQPVYESYDSGNPEVGRGQTHDMFVINACDSITVDYAQREGTSDYQPTEDVSNFIGVDGGDGIWESDPTLQLMKAWLDAEVMPEREALHQAYLDSFNAIAADDATFYAWLRDIYVTGFELAAGQLAEARLVAEATFADGSTTTCAYRIALADGYEQTLADRFDALCELDGNAGVEWARSERLPWTDLPTPTDEQAAADPRLSAPIFVIENVTGA